MLDKKVSLSFSQNWPTWKFKWPNFWPTFWAKISSVDLWTTLTRTFWPFCRTSLRRRRDRGRARLTIVAKNCVSKWRHRYLRISFVISFWGGKFLWREKMSKSCWSPWTPSSGSWTGGARNPLKQFSTKFFQPKNK